MKLLKIKNPKQFALYCLFVTLFFASYSVNFGYVAGEAFFYDFERRPEGLVLGRLSRAAQDGVFSYGGLNGLNYQQIFSKEELQELEISELEYNKNLSLQHDLYITNKPLPNRFLAYRSQSGGQGICFSIIQKFTPFNNAQNLQFFRAINALLFALCLVFFIAWVSRNFGMLSGGVTFILLFLSEMLTLYGHSLWWVVWNFYLPFLTMLLVMEKRHVLPSKYSDKKVCLFIFIAVFLKCFFSGFEFITTTLVSAICPIVYYYTVENKKLWDFIRFSFKVGLTMVFAVLAEMIILVMQLASYEGSVVKGIDHIVNSYLRRTDVVGEKVPSYAEILTQYFQGSAFPFGFLPEASPVYFGVVLLFFLCFGAIIFVSKNKIDQLRRNMNLGLISMTLFSILAPLSWFIIFKEHSSQHPHIDYFVWYLPTFPLGYAVVGYGISLLLKRR